MFPPASEVTDNCLTLAPYFLPLETPGLPGSYPLSFIHWVLSALWNIGHSSMCLFRDIHRISFKCICELESLTCCCFLYRMGNVSLQVWFSFSSSFFFLGLQRKITWLLRSAFVFFAKYELRSHQSEMNLCMKALITNVNWLHYHGMFSYLLRI